MKTDNLIAIIGVSIGVLGFLYGIRKDRDIRNIRSRASSPNFVISGFILNLDGWTEEYGVIQREYAHYIPNIECSIQDRKELKLPQDIPNGQLVSCILKNKCKERIRCFTFKSCRKIFIDWESEEENLVRLNYYHDSGNETIKFLFKYETESGIKGKRKYVFQPRKHSITERKLL